uniref:Late embryogenesis abundant protein LEA-2 subgroup domain-containing protein n=1 Tax=Salix viminalis TaxID=40686 RepID=A0A6N2LF93_SALVM
MHAKTDSDGTSVDTSWQPRSPRRLVYYVQSPSNHDMEKMSYGSSPTVSPPHLYYHCSPIHHSRESSTSRFSNSLKMPRSLSAWKHTRINDEDGGDHDGDDEEDGGGGARKVKLYFIGFLFFVLLFTVFCLILWGASKAYKPEILVKSMVFENFYVQAGNDQTGVPTDMLSLNSTVKIHYRNPATFFAVHVTSTPLEIHYFQLKLASGLVKSSIVYATYTCLKSSQSLVLTWNNGYATGNMVILNYIEGVGSTFC